MAASAGNRLFEIDAERTAELERHIEEALRHRRPGEADGPQVRRIKALIRRGEARAAGRFCGVPVENLHFLDMPFYETGRARKDPLTARDVEILADLLRTVRPHQVYAAGDLTDPHGTHRLCLTAPSPSSPSTSPRPTSTWSAPSASTPTRAAACAPRPRAAVPGAVPGAPSRRMHRKRPAPARPVRVIRPTGSVLTIGLDDAPPLGGLVITAPRPDPLAVVEAVDPDGEPLLAHWQVGLGRVAAFTSDAGGAWSRRWLDWPGYAPFWVGLARAIARPATGADAELLAVIRDGRLHVTLEAAREGGGEGAYLDYLHVDGVVYPPGGDAIPVRLPQTAPGRYETSVPAQSPGNYVVALSPRRGSRRLAPVIGGASQSSSPEFRRFESNAALLERIVATTGGTLLDPARPQEAGLFDRGHRAPSIAALPAWGPLLWAVLVLLLLDVASRRIAWDAQMLRRLATRASIRVRRDHRGREAAARPPRRWPRCAGPPSRAPSARPGPPPHRRPRPGARPSPPPGAPIRRRSPERSTRCAPERSATSRSPTKRPSLPPRSPPRARPRPRAACSPPSAAPAAGSTARTDDGRPPAGTRRHRLRHKQVLRHLLARSRRPWPWTGTPSVADERRSTPPRR